MTLEELKVVIKAETSGLQKGLSDVKTQINNFQQKTDKAFGSFGNASRKAAREFRDEYSKALDETVRNAEAKLEKLRRKLYNSSKYFGSNNQISIDTEGLVVKQEEYTTLLKKYKEAFDSGNIVVDTSQLEKIPEILNDATSSADRLNWALNSSNVYAGSLKRVSELIEAIAHGEERAEEARKNNFSTAYKYAHARIEQLRTELRGLLAEIATLNNVSVSNLVGSIGLSNPELAKSIKSSIHVPQQGAGGGIPRTTFREIAMGMLGIRSIYNLVRRLVSNNENLTNAITNIINTLSAILAPIFDLLAAILNTIAGFLGKLFKVNSKTAKSTGATAKSLASFDEIHNINTASGGAGGTEIKAPSLSEAWEKLKTALEPIKPLIDGIIAGIATYLALSALLKIPKLIAWLKEISGVISSIIKASSWVSGFALIIAGIVMSVESFIDMWKNGWNIIGEILKDLGIALVAIGAIILGAPVAVTAVVAGIVAAISTLAILMRDNWDKIWSGIKYTWDIITNYLFEKVSSIKEGIVNKWNEMKTSVSELTSALGGAIKENWDTIKNNLKNIWDNLKTLASNTWESMKTKCINVFNNLKYGVLNIWNGLKNGIKNPINAIISFINRMINGITSGINSMIRGLNSLSFSVPSWVPFLGGKYFGFNLNTISAPTIPMLANGGLVTGSTLAMVGEYSGAKTNPEVIAPLSKLSAMLNTDETNNLLRELINVVDSKEFKAYISNKEIGKSAVNYINQQSRIMGGSVI